MQTKSVQELRNQALKITNEPIVYYWWFKTSICNTLLHKLQSEIDKSKIKHIQFDNIEYSLLHLGQAKKGHDSLVKYHILDASNFHEKAVENGFLSSLRTTLCGLLDLPMSLSKEPINNFMDQNCIVQRENCELAALNKLEKDLIQTNYLPLNYQHTKGMLTKEHRKILSRSKKMMRK